MDTNKLRAYDFIKSNKISLERRWKKIQLKYDNQKHEYPPFFSNIMRYYFFSVDLLSSVYLNAYFFFLLFDGRERGYLMFVWSAKKKSWKKSLIDGIIIIFLF